MFKPRRNLSQNFLRDRHLVRSLVGRASFSKKDTVLEIGPGQGIITFELASQVNQVLAVEVDKRLIESLVRQLPANVILFHQKAGDFPLPASDYHIFSNLPFSIEGRFIRELINAKNPPLSSHLVVRRKPAQRWASHINHQQGGSQFSVLHGPWFYLDIIHHFTGNDFKPRTKISAVMLRVKQRVESLLKASDKGKYERFIKQGFSGGGRLPQNLKHYFSKQQLNHYAQDLGFSYRAKPTDLCLRQWVSLFKNSRSSSN